MRNSGRDAKEAIRLEVSWSFCLVAPATNWPEKQLYNLTLFLVPLLILLLLSFAKSAKIDISLID